ncbi:MAG TPA: hypothetical protein VNL14_08475 [Candidatus Acidoferrales bacterium]|nr:hypothetical protein [Candidatus Acidoferrales bacterium]
MANEVALLCPKCGMHIFAAPPKSIDLSQERPEAVVRVICIECGYKFRHRLVYVDKKWKPAAQW